MATYTSVFSTPATYSAVVKKQGPWWIGWIEEIPGINCQETTEAELIRTVFPHPTISETMHEAVLDAYGRVLHF